MTQPPPPAAPQNAGDPSMDEILASIRRILSDEEKAAKEKAPQDGVLMLDPSMMIDDANTDDTMTHPTEPKQHDELQHDQPQHDQPQYDQPQHDLEQHDPDAPEADQSTYASAPTSAPVTASTIPVPAPGEPLIAPEAASAAAGSIGALVRTVMAERNAAVHRGGPTIEDVVREEIRPLLKGWLDTHLPAIVERLVRAEIERVMGRVGG